MVVQHNMLAWNADRQYKVNTGKTKKLTEKLASGYKINRAADDAAGLAMSEKMRRQIRGLSMAAENIQEGIGYVQTADGALNEAQDILQRMNELAVKSANGTLTEQDRQYVEGEVQQLKSELDRIFSTTTFNEERIWDPDDSEKIVVGTEWKQAAIIKGGYINLNTTNANCDVLAVGTYQINADKDGGVSEYFDNPDNANSANLFDVDGNAVFDFKISLTVQETATIDDIIECINGTYMSPGEYSAMSGRFEDSIVRGNDVMISSTYLNYNASYASNANGTENSVDFDGDNISDDRYGHDFDAADDIFLEAADSDGNKLASGTTNLTSYPKATTVADAQSSTEKWTFSFAMDGIGKVTATSYSVSYAAPSEIAADDEHTWWDLA